MKIYKFVCMSAGIFFGFSTMSGAQVLAPPKPLSIYILMGQSNMSGAGKVFDLPAGYPRHADKEWIFTNAGEWRPPFEPLDSAVGQLDEVSADPGAGVGPGLSFADTLLDHRPSERIALVPCAKGGTSIKQWERSESRGTLYGSCLHRIRQVQPFGTIKAILWHQGESDASSLEAAQGWTERFEVMIENLRRDVGDAELPLVYAQIGSLSEAQRNRPDRYFAFWEDVKASQLRARVPHAAMIKTDHLELMDDGLHLSTAAQLAMGRLFAEALIELTKPQAAVRSPAAN